MFVIDKIPGLHFRASEQAEIVGMDDTEHAEFAADYVGFRREADTVFTKSEKLWGSQGPPDNVSQRSVRSIHDGERGRGVRVHDAIDEEKANGVDFAGGIPSEAPEKTGYRQPGGNENITRLRSRSRSRGLRSVGEHREVSPWSGCRITSLPLTPPRPVHCRAATRSSSTTIRPAASNPSRSPPTLPPLYTAASTPLTKKASRATVCEVQFPCALGSRLPPFSPLYHLRRGVSTCTLRPLSLLRFDLKHCWSPSLSAITWVSRPPPQPSAVQGLLVSSASEQAFCT